jgi:hypothetical protein
LFRNGAKHISIWNCGSNDLWNIMLSYLDNLKWIIITRIPIFCWRVYTYYIHSFVHPSSIYLGHFVKVSMPLYLRIDYTLEPKVVPCRPALMNHHHWNLHILLAVVYSLLTSIHLLYSFIYPSIHPSILFRSFCNPI